MFMNRKIRKAFREKFSIRSDGTPERVPRKVFRPFLSFRRNAGTRSAKRVPFACFRSVGTPEPGVVPTFRSFCSKGVPVFRRSAERNDRNAFRSESVPFHLHPWVMVIFCVLSQSSER